MLPDFIQLLLNALKLQTRYVVTLAAVAGLLLFADPRVLQFFDLTAMAQEHRAVIALVWLCSVVLLAVDGGRVLWSKLHKLRARRQLEQRITERLLTLTEDEKQILRFYVAHSTRSNTLRVDDGVVQGLVAAGVIYRASGLGNMVEGFAHNISQEAWDELHKNPVLLRGETELARTDKRSYHLG